MKRYQVYLNPHSVSVLDDFEEISDISRSKLIRRVIDNIAEELINIFSDKRQSNKKEYLLDKLAGFIDLKIDKKINLSQHVDEVVYQKD